MFQTEFISSQFPWVEACLSSSLSDDSETWQGACQCEIFCLVEDRCGEFTDNAQIDQAVDEYFHCAQKSPHGSDHAIMPRSDVFCSGITNCPLGPLCNPFVGIGPQIVLNGQVVLCCELSSKQGSGLEVQSQPNAHFCAKFKPLLQVMGFVLGGRLFLVFLLGRFCQPICIAPL